MAVFDQVSWPVTTERLSIRPMRDPDIAALWEIRRLDEVAMWMSSAPRAFEDHRAKFAEPERMGKTLVFEYDGRVIGDLMLAPEDPWAQTEVAEQARGVQAELGWSLDPSYGGRGLATEAVEALLRICFEQLGLRRVVAGCFADNEASWRLMERVGMRRETHTKQDSLHRSGRWLDGMAYGMLADEWRDRHATGAS